jgi:hypothetical protein
MSILPSSELVFSVSTVGILTTDSLSCLIGDFRLVDLIGDLIVGDLVGDKDFSLDLDDLKLGGIESLNLVLLVGDRIPLGPPPPRL